FSVLQRCVQGFNTFPPGIAIAVVGADGRLKSAANAAHAATVAGSMAWAPWRAFRTSSVVGLWPRATKEGSAWPACTSLAMPMAHAIASLAVLVNVTSEQPASKMAR